MKLLSTWFFAAMAFSSASACASVSGGGQRHRLAARDGARHDGVDQRAARRRADHRQHVLLVGGIGPDVAGDEFGGVLELAERLQGGHQHGWLPGGREAGGQSVLSSAS